MTARCRGCGADPLRGVIFRVFVDSGETAKHGRRSLAFGGAFSSLMAVTFPVQLSADLER
jgi:hypothetical protein